MPEYRVTLPTLHVDQVRAYKLKVDRRGGEWDQNAGGRLKAIRCGRRWGKTAFDATWAADGALRGEYVGWFAPDYKTISEVYEEILDILDPVKKASSKTAGVIRTINNGRVDFWTLDNDRAGRSRKYHRVVVDEAAFTNNANMMDIWKRSIFPTLLDYGGKAVVTSNTNGVDAENFFWRICNQPEHGFIEYHAPSWNNPTIPARSPGESEESYIARRDEIFADLKAKEHPMVFAQEYAAEFVDWSGVAFFDLDKLLVEGQPVEMPDRCDAVFAVMDTATKTGSGNDGTGVTYWARNRLTGQPLILLDYDLVQIEGALLETWLPTILQNLETLAKTCGARMGSLGSFIEDKASGEILLQQARRRGLKATAIDSRLTALGKDERALSVSGYHYRGEVKIARQAYDKVFMFKGATRNHLISQVTSFRIGDKDAAKRADDLLDAYCYGIALALGDKGGF